jgi:hypothetical protein
MATALYYGSDTRVSKLLEPFFKDRKEIAGEEHSLTLVSKEEKIGEMLNGMTFDMYFVESEMLAGRPPKDWLPTFQKKFPDIKGPIVLIGGETSVTKIYQILESGWTDYIVEPPDRSLLIEKFGLYATGKRSADIRQVYTMEVHSHTDIAKPAIISHLSEFDCKVKSKQPALPNDLVTLYSSAFSESLTEKTGVLGRCYSSEPDKANHGEFVNSYYLVATTPEVLAQIRNNLRKAYVNKKG